MSDNTRGVLYVVNKPNFVKEALISAESVKKHNPDLPITFFTDEVIPSTLNTEGTPYSLDSMAP